MIYPSFMSCKDGYLADDAVTHESWGLPASDLAEQT